jgi:hypothetical protein
VINSHLLYHLSYSGMTPNFSRMHATGQPKACKSVNVMSVTPLPDDTSRPPS